MAKLLPKLFQSSFSAPFYIAQRIEFFPYLQSIALILFDTSTGMEEGKSPFKKSPQNVIFIMIIGVIIQRKEKG